VEQLDLRDVALAGWCTGAGEVVRFLSSYGSERVSRAVLVSPLPPYLPRAPDNPEGVDGEVLDRMEAALRADRPAFLASYVDDLFNMDLLGGTRVNGRTWRRTRDAVAAVRPEAALGCLQSWRTDFRTDLPKVDVPTLVVQGDDDRVLPLTSTGYRLCTLLPAVRLAVIEGGPHAVALTHADEVNAVLLDFLDD
jgi:non-heme chloroperoxidase